MNQSLEKRYHSAAKSFVIQCRKRISQKRIGKGVDNLLKDYVRKCWKRHSRKWLFLSSWTRCWTKKVRSKMNWGKMACNMNSKIGKNKRRRKRKKNKRKKQKKKKIKMNNEIKIQMM